jgi:hypothetical protein
MIADLKPYPAIVVDLKVALDQIEEILGDMEERVVYRSNSQRNER